MRTWRRRGTSCGVSWTSSSPLPAWMQVRLPVPSPSHSWAPAPSSALLRDTGPFSPTLILWRLRGTCHFALSLHLWPCLGLQAQLPSCLSPSAAGQDTVPCWSMYSEHCPIPFPYRAFLCQIFSCVLVDPDSPLPFLPFSPWLAPSKASASLSVKSAESLGKRPVIFQHLLY